MDSSAPAGVENVCSEIAVQAAVRPDELAVLAGAERLTYRELHARSAAVAQGLVERGVQPGELVAIAAGREVATVVGIVGILRAGAAYVPVDPEYPEDWRALALADSGARFFLAPRVGVSAALETLGIDELIATPPAASFARPELEAAQPAYVIYTSGSTGRPKGVLISHDNLAFSTGARREFYAENPQRFLLLSSFAFDSSIAGIFWTLTTGGTLVLPQPGEEKSPAALAARIATDRITHTLGLPSLHALLLATAGDLSSLRTVIVAGENCPATLPAAHAQRLPGARLFNEYGPTEATVWSTVGELTATSEITIGRAIPGAEILLRDDAGNRADEGEIVIAGPGVALGYLHQPELTAEKFRDGVYRTGDRGRWRGDGQLEFLGRLDRQVKIRGYRIELEAIENVLLTHAGVQAAAVRRWGDRLVAYVAPATGALADLRALLAAKLPPFMMPAAFVPLAAFPLTPNGKIDRAALPAPGRERPPLESTFAPATSALEKFLAAEWQDALRLDEVGIDDRFFELGGDSLLAATVISRLEQRLGEPVFVVAIFEAPTIAQLAVYLRKNYAAAVARAFGETAAPALAPAAIFVPTRRPLPAPAVKNRRAIFILAPPRSGTTLLGKMLGGHPGLFVASELRLLGFATFADRQTASAGRDRLWLQTPQEALAAAGSGVVLDAHDARAINEVYALIQSAIAPRELVEKSPSYALDPAALAQAEAMFADAFYIHLARHPYEMIRSFEQRRMDQIYLPTDHGLSPRAAGELVWRTAHENIRAFLAPIPATRQFFLRYADLVTAPEKAMRELCASMGVPFDAALLEPYGGNDRAHPSDDPRFLEHRAINPEMAEGWRGVLTDDFLAEPTWQLAAQLGYPKPAKSSAPEDDALAIIGLAGRFPGAPDVATFWENLCAGVESIRPFTVEELRGAGVDPAVMADPSFVNAGAVIEGADQFAASFFGYPPREAELMDPQQRLFLECAWEAFEHAGCDVSRFPGAIGVYAGLALNSYFQNNLAPRPELAPLLGQYSLTLGNEKDFVATRVAHKLQLRGPAIGVQTACSSSLVALHLASQALRTGEIDLALVGGGRVRVPLHAGYMYVDGGIPSPDGHCRAFDAAARGCIAGSGMAAVVVKRLADAQRDGDQIFCVLKATAINNDGGAKVGFTAPSVEGQAEVIARAQKSAGVGAASISYVEAHGTGTSLGDPIEVAALTRAFRETSTAVGHCRIGSVKTNIGHLDAGAGAAGLIKTALALHYGLLPPSLNFARPNPQIAWAESPFVVNAELTPWPRGAEPRRAGVSSFGIGGTNAHAILEEAPAIAAAPKTDTPQLLVLSAKTATELAAMTANLARHLRAHPHLALADVAFTLQAGRQEFAQRAFVIARDPVEAAALLEQKTNRGVALAPAPPVGFMFPGQGAQFPGMGRELFETEPVFRAALERCAAVLAPAIDLRAALYGDGGDSLNETALAQPAIFAVEYAMAQLWEAWGIQPAGFIGHSVGEFVAACLAGVFSLEDGLQLLAGRARLMQNVPRGAMLAVRMSTEELTAQLGDDLDLAAVNSPRMSVVSGPVEIVAAFAEKMQARGVATAALPTSHAFHSRMMEPVLTPFRALAAQIHLAEPRVPIFSTVPAGGSLADPKYWARQLREPVHFAAAVASVPGDHLLLEVGPGAALGPLARQARSGPVVSAPTMLEALGRLWLAGVAIDWSRRRGAGVRRVALPTYPFTRERYWIDPVPRVAIAPSASAAAPALAFTTVSIAEQPPATIAAIREMLHQLSGVPVERMEENTTFVQLGLDSLFLTQVILAVRQKFAVTVAFRQLFEELATIATLAAHVDAQRPATAEKITVPRIAAPVLVEPSAPQAAGPFRPIQISEATRLTARQQQHLDELIARYTARTARSKALAARHRPHFADPRSVSGFRPLWKELIYPLAVERSTGALMWDLDGNEYIDFTMGYGTNLLGHSPEIVTKALADQLARGIEIGPQSPLAGEVAEMLCEFSGFERATFANTGSEAVLAAVRLARTVTGRDRIATCSGYHGINDEFLVRAKTIDGERRSVAIAPGIPGHIAREVLAVDYGAPESLEILRAQAPELAAVLIEPVQSRHPDLQPRAFMHEVRRITERSGTALIFDEMITGFRCHPGGAQAWFGVRADMATYGKIIGGGMPMGALCGRAEYLDALDGGAWNYGDASRPETGMTFFAGTYVRHPLAIAASHAMLGYLKAAGGELQHGLNARTAELVRELNALVAGTPIQVESFGSMWIVKFRDDFQFGGLLFFHLRDRGIHAWDNRLFFLSTAHTEAQLAQFLEAFGASVEAMRAAGFLGEIRDEELVEAKPGALPEPAIEIRPVPIAASAAAELQFSLYFFGNYPAAPRDDKYDLIIESTRFADRHGFTAVWLPERHFHSVGGFSPNPAVLAAALARETSQIQLRAGSIVLPLHHPVRVAEEWSLVDNLSRGRVGISIASGWHPNDFVFAPEAYPRRRELCLESLATIQQLWRGEALTATAGAGPVEVRLFPLPVQRELPVWLTCVQRASYVRAGELGLNILAQLQNQSLDEIAEKIAAYRAARAAAGHDRGHVTMLLHTFVAETEAEARAHTREPLRDYLRSHVEISQQKLASQAGVAPVPEADLDFLLERAVEDYARGKAFIGTVASCAIVAENLRGLGVDEVGCLLDFGVEPDAVRESLPRLAALQQRFAAANAEAPTPITIPLTDAQRGLALLASLNAQGSGAYNESSALEWRGPLDREKLHAALQTLVDRHEALRTTIDPFAGTQTIWPPGKLALELTAPDDLESALSAARGLRFDFAHAPILDARLVRLGAENHVLLLTFHHLLGNGPSYVALFEDLWALYQGETAAQLPPARQLRDFVRWTTAQPREAAEQFWLAQFAEPVPPLELPLDHPRPALQSHRGARVSLRLPAEASATLRSASARMGSSLFATLLSAFQVLLHRLSGQDALTVGVPFEGPMRSSPGGDRLFANTTHVVPIISRMQPGLTFGALLAANRQRVLEAWEHQHYFFGQLPAKLQLPFDASRPPLLSAFLNYESGTFRREADGLMLKLITDQEPYVSIRDTSMLDLFLNVADTGGELFFRCDYNCDLFEAATVQQWLVNLRTLLEGITVDSDRPIHALPLLTDEQRQCLLHDWQGPARPYPSDRRVAELFEEHAARTPAAVAVQDGDQLIGYGELNARANGVAASLIARGVQPGDLVGLPAERSIQFVAVILGILKAGGVYVPLEAKEPVERAAMMKSSCRLVVDFAEMTQLVGLAENLIPVGVDGGSPAYVIYTSGSTGTPKGVVVPQRAITRLVWNPDYVSLTAEDVVAFASNASFDAATFEIWGALLNGARLVVTPRETLLSAGALQLHLERHGITTLFVTTALFNQLVAGRPTVFAGLRNLLFGGEVAGVPTVAKLLGAGPPLRLLHVYGPTEVTTFATAYLVEKAEGASLPIGRPISNTEAYILDAARELVAPGVTGELYLGGPGVAVGYHERPELTRERFVETTWGRLYRTGDRARWLPGGVIDFVGRVDAQVKLRGFRIEPGEIEVALKQQPGVTDCTVQVQETAAGDRQLVAYFTPNGATANPAELARALGRRLPAYMIPSEFRQIERLPLTANGKIDVKALPRISAAAPVGGPGVVAPPENSMQRQLVEIWEEILGRAPVGIRDHFFEIGGHSLLAARMLTMIEQRLGTLLKFNDLFERPTIEHIAEVLMRRRLGGEVDFPSVAIHAGAPRTPFFFLHGDFVGGGFYCKTLARHLGEERPFYALHPHGLHGTLPPPTIEAMAASRLEEVRRIQPRGPYFLGGYCNGGMIAFEMARLLEAQGERVARLCLVAAEGSNVQFRGLKWAAGVVSGLRGEDEAARGARFLAWHRRATLARSLRDYYFGAAVELSRLEPSKQWERIWRKTRRVFRTTRLTSAAARQQAEAEWTQPDEPEEDARGRRISEIYHEALRAYVPGYYGGPTLLIWPGDETRPQPDGPMTGWREICQDVAAVLVPGDHHTIISRESHLAAVAERIREVLEQAEGVTALPELVVR